MAEPNSNDPLDYAKAGVNIEAGNALVRRIAPLARATARSGTSASLGGFGAIFDPAAAGHRDSLLVATTDGVGTKLKIASLCGRHQGVGQDLVAMCVNDLVVQGAEPLFFLDYFACGRLDVGVAETVIQGIAKACEAVGCALVGGETAEMPGFYADGDYDLAGFAVGAVKRDQLLPRPDIRPGDAVLALPSSGVHSNGFSLVRKIVETNGVDYDQPAPYRGDVPLGIDLLTPTRLYVNAAMAMIGTGELKALAHITGGGLIENIPRVLPGGLGVVLEATCWPFPPVFDWLRRLGRLSHLELARTFNCGIGLIAICDTASAQRLLTLLEAQGEEAYLVGRVVPADQGQRVMIEGTREAWVV